MFSFDSVEDFEIDTMIEALIDELHTLCDAGALEEAELVSKEIKELKELLPIS